MHEGLGFFQRTRVGRPRRQPVEIGECLPLFLPLARDDGIIDPLVGVKRERQNSSFSCSARATIIS
jgi:hypothetical protein